MVKKNSAPKRQDTGKTDNLGFFDGEVGANNEKYLRDMAD